MTASAGDSLTVTAVIPTAMRRPDELRRAVDSALTQSRPVEGVVVVVDAPDQPLPQFGDHRVRVVRNTGPRGPAAARNTGVRAAAGDLVGLLDDDDHWLPSKVEAQVACYALGAPDAVVLARARVLGPDKTWVVPDEPHDEAHPFVDYLFAAPGLRGTPDHTTPTPTILTSRKLLLAEPFIETLSQWEDYEWLLRVTDLGHEIRWVGVPLAVIDQTRTTGPSLSQRADPDDDLCWADTYLAPRSLRAWHHHRLTYAAPGFARRGEHARSAGLILAAVRDWHAPPALLAKAIITSALPPRWVVAARGLLRN